MPIPLLLWLIATAVAPSNRRGHRHPNPDENSARRWASVKDTAAYIGVTTRTMRQMVADGRLTQYRLGPRIVRFDLNEVDAAMVDAAAR
jgi:excisionase family DNA binding protein